MDKFDLTIVENKIRSGALVYLKRDKDNAEAENAIMVLTEKGYLLGYVSKENNYILKNLMDWGKILYGQIKKVDEDYKSMEIKVYLSYVDVRTIYDKSDMIGLDEVGNIRLKTNLEMPIIHKCTMTYEDMTQQQVEPIQFFFL